LNRKSVWALHYLAQCKLLTGSIEDVIPLEEQAIRLSPREPRIGHWFHVVGTVHLLQSRTDEAIVWLEKARSELPAAADVRSRLASAYALIGETERAAVELAEARRPTSDDRFSSFACLRATVDFGAPKTRALFEPPISPGCARPGCRKSNRQLPVSRNSGRRLFSALAAVLFKA